jgi:tetratricopeptide (TPR) repeat protein
LNIEHFCRRLQKMFNVQSSFEEVYSHPAMPTLRVFFILSFLVALLLYVPALEAPLYLDDPNTLGSALNQSHSARVLGYGSFWLTEYVRLRVGPHLPWRAPFWNRFPNVVIHTVAAVALFWLALELTGRQGIATIAGLMFLVHPLETSAVTYVSQRFESQAALLMILSAASFARFRRTQLWRWLAATVLAAAAAGFTKETALILPVWLGFIEIVFFKSLQWRHVLYAGLAGTIAIAPALLRFPSSLHTMTAIPWDQHLISQGPVLAKYLQLAVYPREQYLLYDFPPATALTWPVIAQWLIVLCTAALGIYFLRKQIPRQRVSPTTSEIRNPTSEIRNSMTGFGLLSFFILLLPVILIPRPDLLFEYRVYGAFAGLALALAAAVSDRRRAVALTVILMALMAHRTFERNREWADELGFYEAHRDRFPNNPSILINTGTSYINKGYVNKALETFQQARTHEDRFNSYWRRWGLFLVAANLAMIHLQTSDLDAAKNEALRAVVAYPEELVGWGVLAQIQTARSEHEAARDTYKRLTTLRPSSPGAWAGLSLALSRLGQVEEAKQAETRALEERRRAEEQSNARRIVPIPSGYARYVIFSFTALVAAAIVLSAYVLWRDTGAWLRNRPANRT